MLQASYRLLKNLLIAKLILRSNHSSDYVYSNMKKSITVVPRNLQIEENVQLFKSTSNNAQFDIFDKKYR